MQVSSFNFDNLAKQTFKKLPTPPNIHPNTPKSPKVRNKSPSIEITHGVFHRSWNVKKGTKAEKALFPHFQLIFFFPNLFSSTINLHRNPIHSHLLSITPISTTFSINLPIHQPQISPFLHLHQNTPFSHKNQQKWQQWVMEV